MAIDPYQLELMFGEPDKDPNQLSLDDLELTGGDSDEPPRNSNDDGGDYDDQSPASLTVVPTSTTDANRPRTLAAGYDTRRSVLTVLFRDGTLWNYYDVTPVMWSSFRQTYSKGVWIATNLDPRGPGGHGQAAETGSQDLYVNAIVAYASSLSQSTFKGTQVGYKAGRISSKTGRPQPVKLTGYQNAIRKRMREGATATEAVRAQQALIRTRRTGERPYG